MDPSAFEPSAPPPRTPTHREGYGEPTSARTAASVSTPGTSSPGSARSSDAGEVIETSDTQYPPTGRQRRPSILRRHIPPGLSRSKSVRDERSFFFPPHEVHQSETDAQRERENKAFDDFVQVLKEVRGAEAKGPMPTLVVIGAQSSGKSTFVQSFVPLPIAFVKGGTGTRCPVEYVLYADHHGAATRIHVGGVPVPNSKAAQDALEKHMAHLAETVRFTAEKITVEIRGPIVNMNLVLLDLPGFVLTGESQTVSAITQAYVRNPSSIIVVVDDADQDAATRPGENLIKSLCEDPVPDYAMDVVHPDFHKERLDWLDHTVFILNKFDKIPGRANIEHKMRQHFDENMWRHHDRCFLTSLKPLAPEDKRGDPLWQKYVQDEPLTDDEWARVSLLRTVYEYDTFSAFWRQHHENLDNFDWRPTFGQTQAARSLKRAWWEAVKAALPELQSQVQRKVKEAENLAVDAYKARGEDTNVLRRRYSMFVNDLCTLIEQICRGSGEVHSVFTAAHYRTWEEDVGHSESLFGRVDTKGWSGYMTPSVVESTVTTHKLQSVFPPSLKAFGGTQFERALDVLKVMLLSTQFKPESQEALRTYATSLRDTTSDAAQREAAVSAAARMSVRGLFLDVDRGELPNYGVLPQLVQYFVRREDKLHLDKLRQETKSTTKEMGKGHASADLTEEPTDYAAYLESLVQKRLAAERARAEQRDRDHDHKSHTPKGAVGWIANIIRGILDHIREVATQQLLKRSGYQVLTQHKVFLAAVQAEIRRMFDRPIRDVCDMFEREVFYTTESLQSKGWTDMLTAHRAIFGSVHTGKAAAVADPAVEQANAESVAGLGAVDSIGSASLIDVLRTKNHPVYLSPGMDGTGDMNQQAEKYFQLYLFKLTNSLVRNLRNSVVVNITHSYINNDLRASLRTWVEAQPARVINIFKSADDEAVQRRAQMEIDKYIALKRLQQKVQRACESMEKAYKAARD